MNKLQKLAPAWHAEATQIIEKNFEAIHTGFISATKQAVWFGIFLLEVKRRGKEDKSIPHGEFGPWLKRNAGHLSWETVCSYMRLARDVCEKGRIQISEFSEICQGGKLPEAVLKIIEGKTQQQLFLEFKQAKSDADGNLEVMRGRREGEGGKRSLSAAEKAWKVGKEANDRRRRIQSEIYTLGINFAGLPDDDLQETIHYLDGLTHLLKSWTNTPTYKRDLDALQAQWNKYFKP